MARASTEADLGFEQHRVELTGYCYRMLGSAFDAEDAVQETMVRAWRAYDRFDGRSTLRTWLYRIATNVSLDLLNGRNRRALPMDLGPASSADTPLAPPVSGLSWVEPIPDTRILSDGDPAEVAAARETVRLAFVAALQHLPPKQRAVLILRDVLAWSAAEAAELLDTTVAGVNSALQRARATLAERDLDERTQRSEPVDDAQRELLARYVECFERYDVDALVAMLHDDVQHNMPPFEMWLQGPDDVRTWYLGPGIECRGSRLLPLTLNGRAGFAAYRPSGPGGRHEPFSIQLLDVANGRISGITYFLDAGLFPLFGLPAHPDDSPPDDFPVEAPA